MTSATGERQDVKEYLEALKLHLGDIPPDERQDVLDDLEAHLAEVAAESEEPLASRLGTPEAYAAELRASAGYAAPVADVKPDRWSKIVDGAREATGEARAFLPEARPGWWLARAPIAVLSLVVIYQVKEFQGWRAPDAGGLFVIALIALATVPASVALGRRAAAGRNTVLSVLVNAAVAVLVLVAISHATDRQQQVVYVDNGPVPSKVGIIDQQGRPVFNIYPFAADGTPLDNVLLYDQDGQPIDNLATETPDGRPLVRQSKVPNSYPQQVLIPDENDPSRMRPDQRPTVVIPRVVESTTTSTTVTTAPPG